MTRPNGSRIIAEGIKQPTREQIEVLLQIRSGNTRNKEIAAALGLNERAVKARLASIFTDLDIEGTDRERKKFSALVKAILKGFIPGYEN